MSRLETVPFRVLLDGSVDGVRRHFRRIFPAVALPLAGITLLYTLLQFRMFGSMLLGEEPDPQQLFRVLGPAMGVVFVLILVYLLAFNATIVSAMDAVSERPPRMAHAWFFSLKPAVFATLFLMGIAYSIAMLMCLVPALYVVPALGFVLPVMADEQRDGFTAIRRGLELAHHNPSRQLIHYPWIQIFVIFFVGAIVSYALTLVVQLPLIIAQQILIFRDLARGEAAAAFPASGMPLALGALASVLGSGATAIAWMFQAFALCVLFREVRRRKEGDDIQAAIQELSGSAPATAPVEGPAP